MNSPCWTFLTWISASADFFVKPGIIRQLTADNLHQQQFFTVQQLLLIFLKIIQEFQIKPLVLINFPFEPQRNNASAVFLFSKTERINQSINYQIEQNSKSAI